MQHQQAKKTKTSSTTPPVSLPNDLVMEVLARMPARSVARFRCACRSWNADTSSPAFLQRHHALAPAKFAFVPLAPPHTFPAFMHIPGATRQNPLPLAMNCAGCPVVVGSKPCHGVVLVRKPCARTAASAFFVYNLTTGYMLRLPPWRKSASPPVRLVEGIGFDAATGEYKVVGVAATPGRKFHCVLLTLGDPRGWRTLTGGDAADAGLLGVTDDAEIDSDCNNAGAVFADGCIHWSFNTHYLYVDKPHGVLSFSLADESFRRVAQPPFTTADVVPYHGNEVIKHNQQQLGRVSTTGGGEGQGTLPVGTTLAELDDRLCLVRDVRLRDDVAGLFEIWKLEDYDAGTWSLDYRVDVAGRRAARALTRPWLVVPLRYLPGGSQGGNNRKLMLATTAQAVHVYDPDTNTLETVASLAGCRDVVVGGGDGVSVRGFNDYLRLLLYQENLVRFPGMESGKKGMIKFVKLSD
ncbi:unnamed protein product [Urochloa humidicola]